MSNKKSYVEDFDFFDKNTQLRFGGSISLALCSQLLTEKENYFNHVKTLLQNSHVDNQKQKDGLLNTFFESFFVYCFARLESLTGDTCDDFAKILHKKFSLSGLEERSKFEGARQYLSLLLDVEFPEQQTFNKLKLYRKVRNTLAHGRNVFSLHSDDMKARLALPGVRQDEDGYLFVTADFCSEFLAFSSSYIEELEGVARIVSESAKSA